MIKVEDKFLVNIIKMRQKVLFRAQNKGLILFFLCFFK